MWIRIVNPIHLIGFGLDFWKFIPWTAFLPYSYMTWYYFQKIISLNFLSLLLQNITKLHSKFFDTLKEHQPKVFPSQPLLKLNNFI